MADVVVGSGGSLSARVLAYEATLESLVKAAKNSRFTAADWGPLREFVAVDEFERVGHRLDVMNWHQYTEFLTKWAWMTVFETDMRHIAELPGVVYFEIEERHIRGGYCAAANSLNVFRFTPDGKICRLDVYMQHRSQG